MSTCASVTGRRLPEHSDAVKPHICSVGCRDMHDSYVQEGPWKFMDEDKCST
jgi:hypothetical protein